MLDRQSHNVVNASLNLLYQNHAAHSLDSVASSLVNSLACLHVCLDDIVRKTVVRAPEVYLRLFSVRCDFVPRMTSIFSWCKNCNRAENTVHSGVAHELDHANVVCLTAWLLEDPTITSDDDGIRSDDETWFRDRGELVFDC